MRRDDQCPLLETKPGWPELSCCVAGVNFADVGQVRELCRLCPLDGGKWMPTCEFMEVYTFLRVEKGQRRIEVRVDCRALEDEVTGCVREDEVAQGDTEQGRVVELRRHPGL